MQRLLSGLAGCALTLLFGAAAADTQETVKIGLIMPYSGQFADTATQMDNGIKLYMKQLLEGTEYMHKVRYLLQALRIIDILVPRITFYTAI